MGWREKTKASVLETWLQVTAISLNGRHGVIDDFWSRVVGVTENAYWKYIRADPMCRQGLKPPEVCVTVDCNTVEARLRPLMMKAVPDGVKKTALNTHETGVADLLFGVMLEAGPGNARDRTQTMDEVIKVTPPSPQGVHDALQNWKFALGRLGKLGVALPDPTIQHGALKTLVSKIHEADPEFSLATTIT